MHPRLHPRRRLVAALALLASFMAPAGVHAASKIKIASIGDEAPGGGQFLGPGLTGAPSAAGSGWVAFRTLVTEGSTAEQIVVTKLAGQEQRHVVAALGQSAGKRDGIDMGTFKEFLGRPTVNADGDVAFLAALTNSDAIPGGAEGAGRALPAGVFHWKRVVQGDQPHVRAIALARDVIPGMGTLDLTTTLDPLQESSSMDLLERTPGLTDAGDVAFTAATFDDDSLRESGAIFVGQVGVAPTPRVRLGDPFGTGTIGVLGSPAINATGTLAFRATVDDELVDGQPTSVDGIFTLAGSTLTRHAADNDLFVPPAAPNNEQILFGFGDLVSLNDAGDVAFTAGGMLDLATFSSSELEFGVLVARQGTVHLVTYPGQEVEPFGRIRSGQLGPDGGEEVAHPSILPDGSVYVFGELTGGNGQALFHASPPDYDLGVPQVLFGGGDPDPSPLGGFYFAAASGPAADAAGNVSFFTRLAGAPVREALVFRPVSGTTNSIVVGEATPTKGRFGGPPFSAPVVNDADTVVFKSSVATGPSSLGLFRWRRADPEGSRLSVLVRTGDAAPLDGAPLILDLPGEPSLNASDEVAFAALIAGVGRGIFAHGRNGIRKIALPDETIAFVAPDAQLESLATNPLMMADGSVAFRATFAYEDPILFGALVHEEGIFRVDPAGATTLLARTAQASPSGVPFFRFRDPSTSGSLIVVRAPIGNADTLTPADLLPVGFFLIDPSSAIRTVVMDDQLVGGTLKLEALTGRATVDAEGNVAFLGRFGADERTVLVRQAVNGTSTVLALVGGQGPAGGLYRSVGRPAMSSNGHVAFRAGFERFGGGTGGFFLAGAAGPRPFVQIGESDDDGAAGRLTSLNPAATLNASDHLAFVSSISSGSSRNGLFLAAPTRTSVGGLAVRRRDKDIEGVPFPFGSARGQVRLEIGDLGKKIQPDRQAVTVVVSDAAGILFSATVPRGGLTRRGRAWGLRRRVAGLRKLQVKKAGKGAVRLSFRSAEWDFPFRVGDQLASPLSVRVDVGAHSGTAIVSCTTAPGEGATCSGS